MESSPCVGNTALVISLLGQGKLKQRYGHNFSVLLKADDPSHGRYQLPTNLVTKLLTKLLYVLYHLFKRFKSEERLP